jgi:hypothetical protein
MPSFKPVILIAAAFFCADAVAAPPAYDGQTPMIEVGPLWFDPTMSVEEQLRVAQGLVQAQATIVAVYGERLGSPRIVWCKTMECALFFSGSDLRSHADSGNSGKPWGDAKYVFSFPALVMTHQATSPKDPRAIEVLTHEMSHIELLARLRGASVPAWFNEGIASYVGKERDCLPGMRGIDNLFVLVGSQWIDYTNKYKQKKFQTYCQARNEVAAWIAEHGGFAAVLDLLAKRSRGKPFNALYGRLHELLPAPVAPSPTPAPVPAPEDNSSN